MCRAPTILKGNLEELQVRLQHDVAHTKTEQGRQAQKIRDDANIMLAGFFLSGCDSKTR